MAILHNYVHLSLLWILGQKCVTLQGTHEMSPWFSNARGVETNSGISLTC